MEIVFLINTYNRQESCQRLVDALQGQGDIVVVNDGCDYIINGCQQHFLTQHNGKTYYWMTVKTLFALRGEHKYYFMLGDDLLPTGNMVRDAINIWENIPDKNKICLNLLADRVGCTCWTNFIPIDVGNVWHTQWVDMIFMCESKFFDIIKIHEVPYSQASKKNMSSGVGAMISRQLHKQGYGLYLVKESLVIPQEAFFKSQMHDPSHAVDCEVTKRARGRRQRIVFDTKTLRKR
jgi:hypothetical protein